MDLVTAIKAPIAPPVAIPGLTHNFVQWLSITALENEYATLPPSYDQIFSLTVRAPVQRLLIAYTVDLIRVLRELFDITLRPDAKLVTTWRDLKEAFETYEQSHSRQHIHRSICSKSSQDGWIVTASDIRKKLRELVNI